MVTAVSWGVLGYLGLQRLWELMRADSNQRAIRSAGGREHAPGHYPFLVAFHAAFFLVLSAALIQGARLGRHSFLWLGSFAAAQALRFRSVRSLGPAWTTRIWIRPGKPLVRTGPYRWIRHPIYLAVFLEVLSVPMAYGLWREALILSLVNAVLLGTRIRAEEQALRHA